MDKKIYSFKNGRWQEVKGSDLEKVNSIITEERITLREMKSKYPSQYKTLTKWLSERGVMDMAKTKEIKELTVVVNGTDRKRKEIERVLRQALNDYQERKGVYDLEIHEVNRKVVS